MEFMAVKRARSCQFVVIVRLVFLPQLDETGVQVVLFFCFWWQMPRGPPRVLCVPRGRKSNQFSLVPNRKYFPTRCAMAVARRTLCSAWFLHRSFYLWAKPEEGDLFWIYALDSERVFACVAQSSCRGVLPDFDSNFLWMMVDWVSRFPRLTLAKQEPGEEAKTGRQWDEGAGRPQ